MHDVFHDHSPMWPRFNHGCPKRPPEDDPYNTPFAVLAYTEGGDPVITVHTLEGETYDVDVKDKIIILKDTTYTIAADGTNIVLTDSDGNEQTIPVFESAEASTTQAGFMSAEDKTKLDSIESGAEKNPSVATIAKNGLMSHADKTKLDSIETGAQRNAEIPVATTTTAGLMSATDKSKLDNVPSSFPSYSEATTTSPGLMSATDKAKLDDVAAGAQVNTIEGITVNGSAITPDANKIVNIAVSGGGGGVAGDVNVIEVVKVNGTALTPDSNKAVDVTVPTKTSDLTNDSTFVTTTEMNTAISSAITGAINSTY